MRFVDDFRKISKKSCGGGMFVVYLNHREIENIIPGEKVMLLKNVAALKMGKKG